MKALELKNENISPKVTSFEIFFMGIGNFFYLHNKNHHLFPSYAPKRNITNKNYLKEFVWIPSIELLTFYNESWLKSQATQDKPLLANAFISILKSYGSDHVFKKDYSSKALNRIQHLPIDFKFWRMKLQENNFDSQFTIDITQLSKIVPKNIPVNEISLQGNMK